MYTKSVQVRGRIAQKHGRLFAVWHDFTLEFGMEMSFVYHLEHNMLTCLYRFVIH